MTEALAQLSAAGVAVWLDDLSRDRLQSGDLARLVADRHVVGVTTNPTIFASALSQGSAYDEQLHDLAVRGIGVDEAARLITAADVRSACDLLRSVFDSTGGRDGRVSLEVDPRLARDADKTVAEARALWWLVDRPNLFIKIPATVEGLSAIAIAISEGISVNVTLIFSLERYEAVLDNWLAGLERRVQEGGSLKSLESVASFFVSRVDSEVDSRLDALGSPQAAQLRGAAAIANARLAYQHYEQMIASDRWSRLAAAGAAPQRPLWASTGVKDKAYDDTRYVVELVAPDTVNTMPEATMDAVSDHGEVRGDTVTDAYADAQGVLERLEALGVSYDDVVATLETQGVAKFEASWDELLETVKKALDR